MKQPLKWISYTFLTFILISFVIILFLLNSTKTVQWAADTYAPQYGFGYKKISGGLLTGVEVEELTFNNDKLLDNLKVSWNPASLLFNRISLTHLEASGLDIKNITKTVDTLVPEKSKEVNVSDFILPVSIGVGELHLSVKPFDEIGIAFKEITLDGEDILFYGEGINADELSFFMDSNVTNIKLIGGVQEKKVRVETLSILDIDTISLEDVIREMIAIRLQEKIVEQVEPEIRDYRAGKENFIPESVLVDSAILTFKPADHPQIRLGKGEINFSSVMVDIHKMIDYQPNTVQVGELSVLIDTNLSRLSMDSTLEDETITVESLSLRDIDTIELTKFFKTFKNIPTTQIEAIDTNGTIKMMFPKRLHVKHINTSIKSAIHDPVFVENSEVNATDVQVDISTLTAKSGQLDVNIASNFVSLVQHGVIKDNRIRSKGSGTVHQAFFETYGLPMKEITLNPVAMEIKSAENQIVFDFDIKGEELLQAEKDLLTIEHFSLKNRMVYTITEGEFKIENEGNLSTPYVKDLYLKNRLTLKDGVYTYKGKVTPGTFEGMDANYTKFLNDLQITYEGNANSIQAQIDAEIFKGVFVSDDFKKGALTLSMNEEFVLKNMFLLPEVLRPSKVALDIHVPLDFTHILPLNASAKITSNLVDMDLDLLYDDEYKVKTKTIVPEDSLLREFREELNFDALSPIYTDLTMQGKILHGNVRSQGMNSEVAFNLENKDLDGYTVLGGAEFVYKGNLEKKISFDHQTSSVNHFLKQMRRIYTFDVPPLEGDTKVSLVLTDMKEVELKFNANTLTYKADPKTEYNLNDTMISLGFSDSVLLLNRYRTTLQKQKFFSEKPSVINFKDGNIEIDPLWINDELKVTGRYNIEKKKGEFLAVSDAFNVSLEKADIKSRINVKTVSNESVTDVKGTVTILGGNINHDMEVKTFSSDSDIVNVQELKKKESSPFMENLSTSIKVHSEEPLIYKTAEADVKVNADLLIQKSTKGSVGLLGTVDILDDSSYSIHNKKFVFKNSAINFIGDPGKPLLDITAMYKTRQSEIMIHIKGSLTDPDVIFSSIPYMSRKKILSTILFGAQDADQDISEENMMLMMGDSMAQSVLSNAGGEFIKYVFSGVGINIDKLPFIGRSRDANDTKEAFFSFFSSEEKVEIPSREIHFTGQERITLKELQKAMSVDTKSIFQFWKEDKPRIKDKLLPTLERSLQNFYHSEGFYDAEFAIQTSKSDVIVNIDENKPVKIKDINVSSDYDISSLITIKEGQIFRSKEFVSIKNNIIGKLMKEGYCSYDLDSKAYVDLETHKVNVDFNLKKGDVCTFGKLTVKGLETIDDSIVISRVRAREGERFSTDRIQDTYDALYDLETFDHISVKHDRKFYNVVPVEVTGTEIARPWYFTSDIDYTSSDGFRVSAGVKRTNFMGNAKSIGLELTYSRVDKGAEISYFVPALFKVSDYYIDLETKIGHSEFKYEGFTEQKGYAEVLLSYNDEKWNLNAGLAIENIDILARNTLASPNVQAGNFLPIYPFLRFSYDNRDSKIHPRYGYYLGGMVEYGLPYDDEKESSYLKYGLEGRAVYSFTDLTFLAIAKAGIVDKDQNEIPESKLFFAGGFDTNRAYGYRELGVITSPTSYTIEGGSTMANLSVEATYPIVKNLYAEIFNDNTMLTKDAYDFNGDIISSAGVGVGYRTQLGHIILNVGMNLEDTSQYEINFYIGQSF